MRSVRRSPEPDFFAQIRAQYANYDQLDQDSRWCIRDALVQEFGTICAYCEQRCQSPTPAKKSNQAEIEHFRPRDKFPDLWLDWMNLVLACRRCNQNKGNRWPGYQDEREELTDRHLFRRDSRYTPVSEYVNPNSATSRRLTGEFFGFNVETGEITPAKQLDREEWSRAYRTIWDIELNDAGVGRNDPNHLCNRRLYWRYLLTEALRTIEDFDAQVQMMLEFMTPGKPFSSFISAYVSMRFPLFVQLFRQP